MHKYKSLGRVGEGTFSEVIKAQSIKTGTFMAIKCMKHVFESLEQVNHLREIQALRRLSPHDNIVKLHEVLYDQPTGRLALVFELMECNIYELIKGRSQHLPEETVKNYMYQLLKAVDHMHRHGIFHRCVGLCHFFRCCARVPPPPPPPLLPPSLLSPHARTSATLSPRTSSSCPMATG